MEDPPDGLQRSVYTPVVDVLAYLVGRYPRSAHADRATAMVTGLVVRNDLVLVATGEKAPGEESTGEKRASTPSSARSDREARNPEARNPEARNPEARNPEARNPELDELKPGGAEARGQDSTSTDREAPPTGQPAYRFESTKEQTGAQDQDKIPPDSSKSVDRDTTSTGPASDGRRNQRAYRTVRDRPYTGRSSVHVKPFVASVAPPS